MCIIILHSLGVSTKVAQLSTLNLEVVSLHVSPVKGVKWYSVFSISILEGTSKLELGY